ncbi:MAG: apolipoprotein N-acyltransferase [Bacteroidetes bacterium]|nr:apolipoprotein N-acyltransferase [Bacteroidota bacterium]
MNAWWWWQATNKPRRLLWLGALLLAAAFPPSPLSPLIWLGFLPLLAVLEVHAVPFKGWKAYRKAFAYGYPMLLLWNLLCCYWLMLTALQVSADEAVVSLTGGLMASALNPVLMLVPILCWVFARKRLPMGISLVCLACYWLAFEYLHFHWDLSWSWLTLGHAWAQYPQYIQYLEFTGILGASAHTLGVTLLLFWLGWRAHHGRVLPRWSPWVLAGWVLFPLLLWPLLTRPGREILQGARSLQVRIVQPNINPYEKFKRAPSEMVAEMAALGGKDLPLHTRLLVYPETAIPTHLELPHPDKEPLAVPFMQLARQYQAGVLIGYHPLRIYRPGEKASVSATPLGQGYYVDSYNGASILGVKPVAVYMKSKLVPFIERAPFMEDLAFLKDWQIDIGGGFSSYGKPDSIHNLWLADGTPVAPLICYESEFHTFVAELVGQGAQLLAVITNDGWWGRSSGYVQHLHLARLRAIETRRDLVRSANTGISAFIDAYGNVVQDLGWNRAGVLDGTVQLRTHMTFFVRYGDLIGKTAVMLAFALLLWTLFRKKWIIRTS